MDRHHASDRVAHKHVSGQHGWEHQFLQHAFGIHEHHGKLAHNQKELGHMEHNAAKHIMSEKDPHKKAEEIKGLVQMEHHGSAQEKAFAKAVLKELEHHESGHKGGKHSMTNMIHKFEHNEKVHKLGFPRLDIIDHHEHQHKK